MPTFDPSDLIGRTFLLPPEENGERHRAKVTRKVVEIIDQEDGKRVENINIILDIGNGKVEELISYNQLLEHLIQFPPEMDENWLRYELLNLGQISRTKLAEDAVLCVHNTASALNS